MNKLPQLIQFKVRSEAKPFAGSPKAPLAKGAVHEDHRFTGKVIALAPEARHCNIDVVFRGDAVDPRVQRANAIGFVGMGHVSLEAPRVLSIRPSGRSSGETRPGLAAHTNGIALIAFVPVAHVPIRSSSA